MDFLGCDIHFGVRLIHGFMLIIRLNLWSIQRSGISLNYFGGNGISETPGLECLKSKLGPETRLSKTMCWMCTMMLMFFSCSTSKFFFFFLVLELGYPSEQLRVIFWGGLWAILIVRLVVSAVVSSKNDQTWTYWTHWDGEIWPWIHMFRMRFHTPPKNKMFKFQDPMCSSRKRRINVFFLFLFGSGVSSMFARTVGAQSGPLRFGAGPRCQKMVVEAWSPWKNYKKTAFAIPILLLNQGFWV